jgi:hypothetical protein
MLRDTLSLPLAAVLATACATGEITDDSAGFWPDEEPAVETPDALTAPEADEAGTEGGETEPGPLGRITYVAEDDADVIVHATIADDVLALYPEGDHYAIRLGDELMVAVIGVDGAVLDTFRIADRAPIHFPGQEDALQVCFPPVVQLPPVKCAHVPCPWPEPFPPPTPWPDCIELWRNTSGDSLDIVGAVLGTPVGKRVTEGPDGVEITDLYDAPLGADGSARLGVVTAVLDDLQAVLPELEPLHYDCLDCWFIEEMLIMNGAACVAVPGPHCAGLIWEIEQWATCPDDC